MRIVQVAHGFPPHAVAGVEVYTRWLARTLAARHEVRVFSTRPDPGRVDLSVVEEELDGLPVTFLINNFAGYDPVLEVKHDGVAARFAAYLDRVRPELVHFQHLIKLSGTLVDQCRARGIPTVLTLHDYWFLCPLIHLIQRDHRLCPAPGDLEACTRCEVATSFLNREEAGTYYMTGMLEPMMAAAKWQALAGIYAGRFAPVFGNDTVGPQVSTLRLGLIRRFLRDRLDLVDVLASPSRFLQQLLAQHGLAPGRIHHCPNAVDTGMLERGAPPVPPPPLAVLYLGTVNKHKGVHVLIEAANRLAGLPVDVTIHGETLDRKYDAFLRRLVRNPRITFGGRYASADLPRLLGAHHVVVMPSLWYENHPIVIREAFAAGVPVVAPDLGAIPEAIEAGRNGLLYEPGDAAALAATLRRLLEEPDLLPRLRAGIEPGLDLEAHARRYEELYRAAALAARRPAARQPPHRLLLAGPSSAAAGFARALGEMLVAGDRVPRPEVMHLGEPGDLARPLGELLGRVGLDGTVRTVRTLDEAGPPDLAVVLPDSDPTLRPRLARAAVPVVAGPASLASLNRWLAGTR